MRIKGKTKAGILDEMAPKKSVMRYEAGKATAPVCESNFVEW
jgi:hypothetical protein